MKTICFLFSLFFLSNLFSQQEPQVKPSDQAIADYKANQKELDKNHGGIGITLFKPRFGDISNIDKPWIGVNILSDIFEFKFGVGETHVRGTVPDGFSFTKNVDSREFGYQGSVGVNFPLPFMCVGSQQSPFVVFRGHPTLGGEIGVFGMREKSAYAGKTTSSIFYLSVNPGYRFRIPTGSVEFNLNLRAGITTGDNDDYYKGSGIYPSITFRFDALKWKYNPNLVSVPATQTTLSNVQSNTYHTGTRYTSSGYRYDSYTTITTADVTVSNFNMGIQDIGAHFGIGPKVSFMNPRRTPYISNSRLIGLVAEGRGGPVDFGVTLEGGKVGHGSTLEAKTDPGKYRKKLKKNDQFGIGTINTVNMYCSFGMDISPIFLIPFGISVDKGSATSYLSATAGIIVGGHISWNQQFDDPTAARLEYDAQLAKDNGTSKDKFIDPSAAKSGYLGGFYFSVQVGAMAFKVTNYRYYGAPFASNTLLSIAYRFPLSLK